MKIDMSLVRVQGPEVGLQERAGNKAGGTELPGRTLSLPRAVHTHGAPATEAILNSHGRV